MTTTKALNLVFLPGMMCDERLFEPQSQYFGKHYPITHIAPPCTSSMEQMAKEALAQMPRGDIVLCGLSMGGIVIMEILRQMQKGDCNLDLKGVILMDTNFLDEPLAKQDIRDAQMSKAKNGGLSSIMIDIMKPNYLTSLNKTHALQKQFYDMAMELGEEVFVAQSQALQKRPNYEITLQNYKQDALVICGKYDQVCTPQRHLEINNLLPCSDLYVINNAAHVITLEQPAKINALMEFWLGQLPI